MVSPSSPALSNSSDEPWIIQKFGGTSIGKFLPSICYTIVREALVGNRVAVVCSARSTDVKAKGTTSRLILASKQVLQPNSQFKQTMQEILNDHITAAKEHIKNPTVLSNLESQLKCDCDQIIQFMTALATIREVSPRSEDVIIGSGELLSCRLISAVLEDSGIPAQVVNLDNVIQTDEFTSANLTQPFYDYLAKEFSKEVIKCGDKVPVITGFFGPVPGSLLKSIGRGYTDLTAALVAVGLEAKELQIWKEVDGIFTADPRKVAKARLLPVITPEEASELTYYGSEVIHPFTMDQVIKANIPIRIKNVQNPSGQGSIIIPNLEDEPESSSSIALFIKHGYSSDLTRRHPTAVTLKDQVTVLNVTSNRKSVSYDFFANIFRVLDKHSIVIDLISTSEVHVSMAVPLPANDPSLLDAVEDLKKCAIVNISPDLSILSLVGKQMKNMVGIAAQMFGTLAKANINIEMISQGSSEINISCVIQSDLGSLALNSIHEALLEWTD
ncbi:aspartate kinase [Conidiobolus coronatus NRRL 28638]|uniref:Aspartokinase n=1 Tax=Conidiobolus coronatus (strain ATCC 28846 / CBS 209.66 / NRRL 28638) TaxID=796925 RepID=A0A137P1T8_CONC2|nr:aspartate kinase [Conidiobolus coronatus NRRL 28638]|eukprot:KXN69025.1 aspartate kinase [Conidiobolus coronatus NRRL 28638]